jgi:ligand-binding sensor domain-containing protein
LRTNTINCIFQDYEGRVWCGTGDGATGYKAKSWTTVYDEIKTPIYRNGALYTYHAIVRAITQAPDGYLWFGMQEKGVVRYKKNSTTGVSQRYSAPTIPGDFVMGVCAENINTGEVWVVSYEGGAGYYTPNSNPAMEGYWTIYGGASLSSNHFYSCAYDPIHKKFWFGVAGLGAISYDGDAQWIEHHLPLAYDQPILSMAFDLNGFGWFGKKDSGVSVIQLATDTWAHHYTTYNTNGLLPHGPIHAIATDLHSTRWFGTDYGVTQLADSAWSIFNNTNSPLSPIHLQVIGLAYDGKGNLWIGTRDDGVFVYNPTGTRL